MTTRLAIAALAVALCLATAPQSQAQSFAAHGTGQLLAEAELYTEEHIGGSFSAFVAQYAPSVSLEATVWELTSNSDTLARLADLFGWSDPWRYRRAAASENGLNKD